MTGTGSEPSTQPARRVAAWRTCASEPCACVRRRILVESVHPGSFVSLLLLPISYVRCRRWRLRVVRGYGMLWSWSCARWYAVLSCGLQLQVGPQCQCISRVSCARESSCCTWVARSVARGGGAVSASRILATAVPRWSAPRDASRDRVQVHRAPTTYAPCATMPWRPARARTRAFFTGLPLHAFFTELREVRTDPKCEDSQINPMKAHLQSGPVRIQEQNRTFAGARC